MSRPDTALRRSDELLAVNQPAAALSSVSEIFASKRFRSTPLSTLEPIMLRFIDLCVLLRKGKTAKEGLHLYKNHAQVTSIAAVETVMRHFLDKSKEKLNEALAKVDEIAGPADVQGADAITTTTITKEDGTIATVEVEDLDAAETPESILLSAVSDEKSRDRTYRTLVTPWLRFLWESYRTALEILRNNSRLEILYQQVALEAFQFCLTHIRKTEFRRLTDILRTHFANAQKYSQQTFAINISDPETLQRYLDTRFAQLNAAVELELWQEAFRSAEDIHHLVATSKRMPRPSVMASFYEKLVKVFAVGRNFLFHAAAYSKLWTLQAATSSSAGSDNDRIAGLVLLSALSVPIIASDETRFRRNPVSGEERDYTRGRMTLMGLLDLPSAPTRATLLSDALKRGILKSVAPELRELYQILEVDFHPLRITAKVEPILANLQASPETARYVEPLKNVVLSRIFEQLAQAYDSIRLSRIVKLATFNDEVKTGSTGFAGADARIERFITEACRRGELSVRLDHADGIVEFEDRLFETGDVSSDLTTRNTAGTASLSNHAADLLQPLPSTLLQTHLTRLAQSLYASLDIVAPQLSGLAVAQANAEKAMKALSTNLGTERESVLSRRLITEQRKQRAEAEYMRREKEAEAARATAKREHEAREARRVEQEARNRQLEIIRKNNDAVKAEEAKKLAEKLRSAGALKVADKDIENLDTAALMRIQVEQLEKTRKEMAEKLRVIGKRIDHTERAFRREEIPLLELDYDLQQKRDREIYMAAHVQRVEHLRVAHAQDVKIKARIGDILPDFERFKVEKTSAVRAEYEKRLQKSVKKIDEEKEKRKTEVENRRKAAQEKREREAVELKAAQEAERVRQEQEEERLEAERIATAEEEQRAAEAKRKEAEEREARRAEELERRSKADEQTRKQREREAEVERRLAEKEAAKRTGPPSRITPGGFSDRTASSQDTAGDRPKVPGIAPGSWRERQAAKAAAGGNALESVATPVAAAPPAVSSGPIARTQSPAANGSTDAPQGERRRLQLAPRSAPAPQAPVARAGGWRDRVSADTSTPVAAKAAAPAASQPTAGTTTTLRGNANGKVADESTAAADDGFQTVQPVKKAGAYRPPGARGAQR